MCTYWSQKECFFRLSLTVFKFEQNKLVPLRYHASQHMDCKRLNSVVWKLLLHISPTHSLNIFCVYEISTVVSYVNYEAIREWPSSITVGVWLAVTQFSCFAGCENYPTIRNGWPLHLIQACVLMMLLCWLCYSTHWLSDQLIDNHGKEKSLPKTVMISSNGDMCCMVDIIT
jgi:hypothetical protein